MKSILATGISIIVILSIFIACEDFEDNVPFRTFTIPEGKHSSNHTLSELEHEWLSYEIIFDESAIYETVDPNNQADINKLFGFSECNSLHEENSIRFGWRWFNDELQVFSYQHLDGEILWEEIGAVELNKPYRYTIYLFSDRYELEIQDVNNKNTRMSRSDLVCNKGGYYQLWPYFGGDETAPHEINIFMRQRWDVPVYKKKRGKA